MPAARSGGGRAATGTRRAFVLRDIKHVFLIVLENEDYADTFGSSNSYLAHTLPSKGLLLEDYYGIGHESNDNYVALVSGQAPNVLNQSDCVDYANFADGYALVPGEPGQQLGVGCVYPSQIATIGTQLSAHHLSWKAYEEDMGNIPSRESAACGHPAIDHEDGTETAVKGDGYASRHDPFVYFHSVIDDAAYCDAHVVALGTSAGRMPASAKRGETGLATDLRKAATTPDYSFITPNLCDDGHDYPCVNQASGASATADIDRFLEVWVPKIMSSPAYRQGGLIEITFDEADAAGGSAPDASSCCREAVDPNATAGLPGLTGPGGGRIGAVLISPFLTPGTRSTLPYNHYSTLATDEAIFGLPRLGYAQDASAFSTSLFRLP